MENIETEKPKIKKLKLYLYSTHTDSLDMAILRTNEFIRKHPCSFFDVQMIKPHNGYMAILKYYE